MKRLNIYLPVTALILAALAVPAAAQSQPGDVNMTLSGTSARSTVDLAAGAPTAEYSLTGDGTLGPFSFRTVSTGAAAPQQSSTCSGSNKLYFPTTAGGGVFRSQDGSLLTVNLTGGDDCIDLSAGQARCTRIYQITGGSGRFKGASGNVTMTLTVVPILADASNNPVLFAATGEFTGMASGVAMSEQLQEARR